MPVHEQELESLYELESEFESELEGELESEFEGEFESESEFEGEGESEFEFESESEFENPTRRVYSDAMMEHLGHVASECETEQEAAEQFLPLISLAAKKLLPMVARAVAPAVKRALPRMAKAITRVEPRLTRGVTRVAKVLHRNPATRPLLRAMPAIARRTVQSVARQAAHGRPVTAKSALRTLAHQARRVLTHPHHRLRAMRRSTILDNHLHRRIAPGVARPHLRHHGGRWHPRYGFGVPGAVAGAAVPGGIPGAGYAGSVAAGGVCTCGSGASQAQYCRCCGQVIR